MGNLRRLCLTLALLGLLLVSASARDAGAPQLILQAGHPLSVTDLAWSPDGRTVASASGDVKLWSEDGLVLATLRHPEGATALAWSPGGRALATGDGEGVIRLWDPATGMPGLVLEGTRVGSLDWSPDGSTLASLGTDGTVRLWDPAAGTLRASLEGNNHRLSEARFSPDGSLLAVGGPEGRVNLWSPVDGKLVASLEGHPEDSDYGVSSLTWSPDGRRLATRSSSGTKLWDIESGVLQATLDKQEAATFRPDGKVLATAQAGKISLWDAQTGSPRGVLEASPRRPWAAWAPDGSVLATGGGDNQARLWEGTTRRGTLEADSMLSDQGVRSPAQWSPVGNLLAAGGDDGTVKIWDVDAGTLRRPAASVRPVYSVAWSPDGALLATGSEGAARLWGRSGVPRAVLNAGYGSLLTSVAFSPDGRLVAAPRGERTVRLWRASTGEPLATLKGDGRAPFTEVAFSHDGKRVAAVSRDKTAWLWDAASGAPVARLSGRRVRDVPSLAWSPTGEVLATGGCVDATARLWDGETGELRATLTGHRGPVHSLAWSPDGRTLVTAGVDSRAILWDGTTGEIQGALAGHEAPVAAVRWSPDGAMLATGGYDHKARLWDREGALLFTLEGHTDAIVWLSFDPSGDTLVTGSRDGTVKTWDRHSGALVDSLPSASTTGGAWRPDGRVLATAGADGTVQLWAGAELLARLVDLDLFDWLVVTPEGFFDGTPNAWDAVRWRLSGGIRDTAEPEQFFGDFYHPGVLGEVLEGARPLRDLLDERGDPRATLTIAGKDRRLPTVAVGPLPVTTDRRTLDVAVAVEAPSGAGVRDVRLFRNDTLVCRWPGPQTEVLRAKDVPVVAGENRFSAYAFNSDGVKSQDAPTRLVTGASSLAREPIAYVLAIGIDRYADSDYNLDFAVADARVACEALSVSLSGLHSRIEARLLPDEQATREGILAALDRLASEVQPEDTVVVSYSGHGILRQGRFALVPHDGLDRALDERELALALERVKAQNMALILDACHSGGLDADDWRQGPVNARGLAQMAYDKGIEVITASQTQQAALEVREVDGRPIGHGLLTYALMLEGFERAPRRKGRLWVRHWLDYAALRVPQLLNGEDAGRREVVLSLEDEGPARAVQTPRVFHRRRRARQWPVAKDVEGAR